MSYPADYLPLVTGSDGGLTADEAKAIADRVLGSDREAEAAVNAKALADFILRGD